MNTEHNKYITYSSSSSDVKVKVLLKRKSVWLTTEAMTELFASSIAEIGEKVKSICEIKRLSEEPHEYSLELTDSYNEKVKYYNLEIITSVGEQLNSDVSNHFIDWAVETLERFYSKESIENDFKS